MVQILLGRKDRKEIARACLLAEEYSTPLTCSVYVSKFVFKNKLGFQNQNLYHIWLAALQKD